MAQQPATHCKVCKESFEVVQKYVNHALCYDCYLEYQRNRKGWKNSEDQIHWKIENRKDIYKERSNELKGIKERTEWLKVITRNLETTLNELGNDN